MAREKSFLSLFFSFSDDYLLQVMLTAESIRQENREQVLCLDSDFIRSAPSSLRWREWRSPLDFAQASRRYLAGLASDIRFSHLGPNGKKRQIFTLFGSRSAELSPSESEGGRWARRGPAGRPALIFKESF